MGKWRLRLSKWFADKQLGGSRSSRWSSVRKHHITLRPKCEVCRTKRDLDVHHIIPFHIAPERELDLDNLITLCTPHHFLFGHLLSWRKYNPDISTDAKIWQEKLKTVN